MRGRAAMNFLLPSPLSATSSSSSSSATAAAAAPSGAATSSFDLERQTQPHQRSIAANSSSNSNSSILSTSSSAANSGGEAMVGGSGLMLMMGSSGGGSGGGGGDRDSSNGGSGGGGGGGGGGGSGAGLPYHHHHHHLPGLNLGLLGVGSGPVGAAAAFSTEGSASSCTSTLAVFLLLILFYSQDLNPSFVFWLCVAFFLLATFTHAATGYSNYQHLRRLAHGDPSDTATAAALAAAVAGGGGAAAGALGGDRTTSSGEFARRTLALRLALMERDFGASDYEVLLALDDDSAMGGEPGSGGIGGRGAPPSVIDQLPCYVFPHFDGRLSSKSKDRLALKAADDLQCSICLEGIQAGNEVRVLPCLHQFHKHCIDRWLGTCAVCALCKQSI